MKIRVPAQRGLLLVALLSCGGCGIGLVATGVGAAAAGGAFSGGGGSRGAAVPAVRILTSSLPSAEVDLPYTVTLQAADGTPPFTWTLDASTPLPAGLTLVAGSGRISGTPTTSAGSPYTLLLRVTDAAGQADARGLTLTVSEALTVTAASPVPDPADQGIAYTAQPFTSSGGLEPKVWKIIAGRLPDGYTFSPDTGTVGGTTTQFGTFPITARVTDVLGAMAQGNATVTVVEGLAVTSQVLPLGVTTHTYQATIAATGGTPPYAYAVTQGSLPAGLSIDGSSGAISGTPTTKEVRTFEVTATDGRTGTPRTAKRNFTIELRDKLTIVTTSLPEGEIAVAYLHPGGASVDLVAQGATGALTWSLVGRPSSVSGEPDLPSRLPAGLALDQANGRISGTPTGPQGSTVFRVRVEDPTIPVVDPKDPQNRDDRDLVLLVRAELAVTTSTLPEGTVGESYSVDLARTGGVGTVTWSLAGGALPAGLSLAGDRLVGTPTTSGAGTALTIRATDALGKTADQKNLTISVYDPVTLAAATLPDGEVGWVYKKDGVQTVALVGAGGKGGLAWSYTGALPDGLALGPADGTITGTPTAAGTSAFAFTVTVSDQASPARTATRAFAIRIHAALNLTSLPATFVEGVKDVVYQGQALVAGGGKAPVAFTLEGTPPPGLAVQGATLAGTPTADGSYAFTVRATDDLGATLAKAVSLVVSPTLAITTVSLPRGRVGEAYATGLQAAGGTPPYTWARQLGDLPAGIALDVQTGALSGTVAGTTATATFRVTDATLPTALSVTKTFTINVTPALAIDTSSLPAGEVGVDYTATTLAASGGAGAFTWAIDGSGEVPQGMQLDPATGRVSGRPGESGSFPVTFEVTDGEGYQATRTLTIAVLPSVTVTTSSLPEGRKGDVYPGTTLQAAAGQGPYTWSATGLLSGLAIGSATGVVWGTPAVTGQATVTVTVTDALGGQATRELALTIRLGFPADLAATNVVGNRDMASSEVIGRGVFDAGAALYDPVNDTLFVADRGQHRVLAFRNYPQAFTSDPGPTHVIGQADFTSGYPNRSDVAGAAPTAATLNAPTDVDLVDGASGKDLWVADSENHRVLVYRDIYAKLTAGGDIAADAVVGQADLTKAETSPTVSTSGQTLNSPKGIHLAGTPANLYVADTGAHRCLIFQDVNTQLGAGRPTADVVLGQADAAGDSSNQGLGAPTASTLDTPYDLHLDAAGPTLYVADAANSRVLAWTPPPTTHGAAATAAILGGLTASPDSPVLPTNPVGFPTGVVTVNAGGGDRLVVTDLLYNRVVVYDDLDGGETGLAVIGQVDSNTSTINQGLERPSAQTLNGPFRTSAFDDGGTRGLVVADTFNGRVLLFPTVPVNADHGRSATAVVGQQDFTMGHPGGHVLQLVATLEVKDVGSASDSRAVPAGVLVAGGRLVASDARNHRVLLWNAVPTTDNAQPDRVFGQTSFANVDENGVPGVVDAGVLSNPAGLASDGTRLYIADPGNHRVLVIDDLSAIATSASAADFALGQPSLYQGNPNQATAGSAPEFSPRDNTLRFPVGVSVGSLGGDVHICVADLGNHRVLVYRGTPTASNPSAVAQIGHDTTGGLKGFDRGAENDAAAGASAGTLAFPSAVFLDAAGDRLLVADTGNHRVLVYEGFRAKVDAFIASGTRIVADTVLGQADAAGVSVNRGLASAGADTMAEPAGIASDGITLLVADRGNSRILVWNAFPAGGQHGRAADQVIGQSGFGDATANPGGTPAATTLARPQGIHFEGTRLFVSDADNSRVLIYR